MKKRLFALLLAGVLLVGACGLTAVASESRAAAEAKGTLSFENLEGRMRENNLDLLTLEQTILALESLDYDDMTDKARDAVNMIVESQWGMLQIPMGIGSIMSASMQSSYDAAREQFEKLYSGEMQKDNADLIRQLKNAQNQLILVGQTLYIQHLTMSANAQTMERNLAALDRNIAVAELSVKQGNLAPLTLEETRAGRTSLVSGMQSLDTGMELLALQLQSMVGEELTGKLELSALPKVEKKELDAMDEQADLEKAREASYTLYEAQKTYDKAEETYLDAVEEYGETNTSYLFTQAKHTWKGAQLTYQSAQRSFELSFRTL